MSKAGQHKRAFRQCLLMADCGHSACRTDRPTAIAAKPFHVRALGVLRHITAPAQGRSRGTWGDSPGIRNLDGGYRGAQLALATSASSPARSNTYGPWGALDCWLTFPHNSPTAQILL
jgi:hypothetical protein